MHKGSAGARNKGEVAHLQQLVRAAAVGPLEHVHLPLHPVAQQLPGHQVFRDSRALLENESLRHPDDLRQREQGSDAVPGDGSRSLSRCVLRHDYESPATCACGGHLQQGLGLSITIRSSMLLPWICRNAQATRAQSAATRTASPLRLITAPSGCFHNMILADHACLVSTAAVLLGRPLTFAILPDLSTIISS